MRVRFSSYPGNGEGQVEVLSTLQPEAPGGRASKSNVVVAAHCLLRDVGCTRCCWQVLIGWLGISFADQVQMIKPLSVDDGWQFWSQEQKVPSKMMIPRSKWRWWKKIESDLMLYGQIRKRKASRKIKDWCFQKKTYHKTGYTLVSRWNYKHTHAK